MLECQYIVVLTVTVSKAMVTTMPPRVLLFLLVLSSGPGGVPCLALATSCDSAQIFVGQSEIKTVQYQRDGKPGVINTTVYVTPESGFQGVALEAENSEGKHEGWYDFEEECFAPNNIWSELKATVGVVHAESKYYLFFSVKIGKCYKKCIVRETENGHSVWYLAVIAHGPSKWRVTPPPSYCDVMQVVEKSMDAVKHRYCMASPSSRRGTTTKRTTSTSTTTTTTNTTTATTAGPATASSLTDTEGSATFPPGVWVWVVLGVVGVMVTVVVVGSVVIALVRKGTRRYAPQKMDETGSSKNGASQPDTRH